jgi:hypothetical protein
MATSCSRILTYLVNLELAMLSSRRSAQLIDIANQAGLALAFELDDNSRNCLIVRDLEDYPSADEVQVRKAIVGLVEQNGDRHGFRLAGGANKMDT